MATPMNILDVESFHYRSQLCIPDEMLGLQCYVTPGPASLRNHLKFSPVFSSEIYLSSVSFPWTLASVSPLPFHRLSVLYPLQSQLAYGLSLASSWPFFSLLPRLQLVLLP